MNDTIRQLKAIGYAVWNEGDSILYEWRGHGVPKPEVVRPLLDGLRQHKPEALEALNVDESEDEAVPAVPDPFDPDRYPADGLIITLPDLDRSGWWTARRTGTCGPTGSGPDQWEAILDLDRLEAE